MAYKTFTFSKGAFDLVMAFGIIAVFSMLFLLYGCFTSDDNRVIIIFLIYAVGGIVSLVYLYPDVIKAYMYSHDDIIMIDESDQTLTYIREGKKKKYQLSDLRSFRCSRGEKTMVNFAILQFANGDKIYLYYFNQLERYMIKNYKHLTSYYLSLYFPNEDSPTKTWDELLY